MAAVNSHIHYMSLALREARKGLGRTSPNPCVGAVIVKDGTVLARGYHRKAGTPHAEINALREAGAAAAGATMYVTLEPCNHTGRTPPCSHAVAESGIKRVVIGMRDPNPLVDGSGVDYLREWGVEVIPGVLEEQCIELNRPFIKHISTGLPWVIMKAGLSLDGRISYRRDIPGAITGPESLQQVHRLRDCSDALLVGIGTLSIDDPALTTRLLRGSGKDPVRIILDTELRISERARVLGLDSEAPTWLFCSADADPEKARRLESDRVAVHRVEQSGEHRLDLAEVLDVLGSRAITSLLVEGGALVHGAFLRHKLVDHAKLFYAPTFIGDRGTPLTAGYSGSADRAGAIQLNNSRTRRLGEDLLVEGDVKYPA
jgi:diaminohydroxyphosphoribosylaminopyrimidine deaminase/5-amino-6-(5-phosphoribosylamino)uracil reductase